MQNIIFGLASFLVAAFAFGYGAANYVSVANALIRTWKCTFWVVFHIKERWFVCLTDWRFFILVGKNTDQYCLYSSEKQIQLCYSAVSE